MKLKLLKFLVCFSCGRPFKLEVYFKDNEIKEGLLACTKCGKSYPIKNYIPRILPPQLNKQTKKTAESFTYEWKNFSNLYNQYKRQFLDWVFPIKPQFFKNKIILDAGCGVGRHVFHSARFGAKEVIGVDLSNSVDVAYQHVKRLPNVHIIQADIYNLPFKRDFDFIYSIGVLHHLPYPERGFRQLLKYLKANGKVFACVYGREGNKLLRGVLLLRRITTKLPLRLTEALSFLFMVFLFPTIRLIYRPLNNKKFTKRLAEALPQNAFFNYLSDFTFKQTHSIIFDQLFAPIANYYTKEEFSKWFKNAKLKDIVITQRNNNSWRGFGRLG